MVSEILVFLGWLGFLVTLGLGYLYSVHGEAQQDSKEFKVGFFSKTWAVMILGVFIGTAVASLVQPEFPMRSITVHFNIQTLTFGVAFSAMSGLMCYLGKRNGSNFRKKKGCVVHGQI